MRRWNGSNEERTSTHISNVTGLPARNGLRYAAAEADGVGHEHDARRSDAAGLHDELRSGRRQPEPMALPVAHVDYKLRLVGRDFLDGKADSDASIPARGSMPVVLPVRVTFENLI